MEHNLSPEESQPRRGVFLSRIIDTTKEQVHISTLGHKGHGKTTLTAAIVRVLAKANHHDTSAIHDQLERMRGTTISCSHVAYTHEARQYLHADYATHTDILKGLITGYYPLDGAILVISTLDGPTPQTREQLLLAHRLKVPALVVFLNQFEEQEDAELRAVVELEVHELISTYRLQGDDIPIIRGSARNALESSGDLSRADPAARCIWELLHAMNSCIPTPAKSVDKPFLMTVEDVFAAERRGVIVVGRIERGLVEVGDSVEIVGMQNEKRIATIIGIEMFKKPVKRAQAGECIGCVFENMARNEISRGQILAKPGSVNVFQTFKAQIYVPTKEEGGRQRPFFNGYRLCFYLRTTDIVGEVSLPEDVESVLPGDMLEITVRLVIPMVIEVGTRFAMREGGRNVGIGICTALLD